MDKSNDIKVGSAQVIREKNESKKLNVHHRKTWICRGKRRPKAELECKLPKGGA
uniref:Uncharacterized protein n=1 Tax=Xenopus tropicalis TaxID=8364 RepID=A0A1B8XYA1_XENTR